jgi:hypothetical protein
LSPRLVTLGLAHGGTRLFDFEVRCQDLQRPDG